MSGCAETDSKAAATSTAGAEAKVQSSPPVVAKKVWRPSPEFKPPFPDRQEMFVPPSPATLASAPREAGASDVALRGFADFRGRRAVLEISGAVTVLREGEERHGIKVLAIDPPRVTLERSGQRWTESLLEARPTGPRS